MPVFVMMANGRSIEIKLQLKALNLPELPSFLCVAQQ
jgi:hypothetical protein